LALDLRKRGFEVHWKTSGDEALAWLDTEDLDVLVTDLAVDQVGGIELCERVMANHAAIPVVVITGFGEIVGQAARPR
jgi:DNA-binding response OmpR family regulator